jgi:hypothetical protein
MDTAEAVRETLVESIISARSGAALLSADRLTRDAWLKSHLLDLGLELEQHIGLIERRARTT